jgi:hypothetical protein
MNRSGTIVVGTLLILLGIYLFLTEYGFFFRINMSWPAVLIVLGGVLILAYYSSKPRSGYLRGGTILVALGVYFTIVHDILEPRHAYPELWPGIIIAIGVGQLVAGLLGRHERALITGGLITMFVGGALLLFTTRTLRFGDRSSIVLIAGGLVIIFGIKIIVDALLKGKAEA